MNMGFVSYRSFTFLLLVSVQFFDPSFLCAGPGFQFIENKNQWDRNIHFSAKVPGGHLYIQPGGFSYYLLDERKLEEIHEQSHHRPNESTGLSNTNGKIDGHFVRMKWIGNYNTQPKPFGKFDHYYNFFHGSDPSRWGSKAYAYEGFVYPLLYDGIDLMVYSSGKDLKYDFLVSAGADPSQIKGRYEGANSIRLDEQGNLYVITSVGQLIEKRPYAYQFIDGEKKQVACDFVLEGDAVSFCFPEGYDLCEPLIIDPLLIFSTYSGSTADNWGSTATPGEHGNLYSAGVTILNNSSVSFPATPGAFQTTYGGLFDVGILKYDSTGTDLLWASYLGGSSSEFPHSLVMNGNEDLLVLGTTSSSNFPTTANAFDGTFHGGEAIPTNVFPYYSNGADIFVARISKDGSELLASTFIGGSGNDGVNPPAGILTKNYGDELRGDIITSADGDIFISTVTASNDFPALNSFDTLYNGGATDALLLKLPSDLSQITWAAFIGGTGVDASHTLKIDSDGNIFIAGGTNSVDFPTTDSTYLQVIAGNEDGWIAHIDGDGSGIKKSTFTGTSAFDQVYFLDLNVDEEVFVYGQTTGGTNFPITVPGRYPNSGQFVQRFSNDLSTLIMSTVFGSGRGIPDISPTAFQVNECNNLYMAGWGGNVNSNTGHWQSNTVGMPTTSDAFQSITSGSDFYFIVLTEDASELLYATYLGGAFSRTHVDGGTSRFDKGGIVYHAVCSGCAAFNATNPPTSTSDFPTTPGAWSRVNGSANCNNAAFKFDLASLRARLQTNSVKLDMPGLKSVCIPDKIVFQNLSTGGKTYEWDLGDGTRIVKPDTSLIVHQYQNTGRYLVKLKAIDPGTCKVTDSTSTFVDVYVKKSWIQDDDDLCEGTLYTLKAGGGNTYHWISEDGSFESSDETPVVNPTDTLQYYVAITESSGCINEDTVQLNVIPSLLPGFEMTMEGECKGRPVIHVRDTTHETENAQLIFDLGDGTITDVADITHAYENDGLYTVKLTGVREFCVYETSRTVPVFNMTVPNIITPEQTEGKNDTFIIQYGEQEGVTPGDFGLNVSVAIYNRWGNKVFESNDYQYDWSAEGLSAGVYFYEVTVEDHATCKSWVQVVR